jgi:hypothetical protein
LNARPLELTHEREELADRHELIKRGPPQDTIKWIEIPM